MLYGSMGVVPFCKVHDRVYLADGCLMSQYIPPCREKRKSRHLMGKHILDPCWLRGLKKKKVLFVIQMSNFKSWV